MKLSHFSLFSLLLFLSSCSGLIETTRKSVSSDDKRVSPKGTSVVSRSQYDDLMERYRSLAKEHDQLKQGKLSSVDGPSVIDKLSESTEKGTMTESVDVFASKTPVVAAASSKKDINSDIDFYQKALKLQRAEKRDEALKIFQHLERSQNAQIKVRATSHIGQIYIFKGQYDLALQVYEKIISSYAFSSIVLDALKGAVVSAKMLGQEEKRMKYASMLTDIFGVKA